MVGKRHRLWFILVTGVTLVYGLVFAMQFNKCLRLDISAFYTTAQALSQGLDPYQNFVPDYLPHAKKLPANLNPPIFLLLFRPLSQLPYEYAVPVWSLFIFALGIWGAWLTFRLAFPKPFIKRHGILLLAVYLLLFNTLMDTVIVQMGSVIFFMVMAGYFAYTRGHDRLAGCLWGSITAIKLFPGLLFVFAFRQRRYTVCLAMALSFIVLWLIPLFTHGAILYEQYFTMMKRVLWYGDSWNASIHGYLYRLLIDNVHPDPGILVLTRSLYLVFFTLIFYWYCKAIKPGNHSANPHYAFCLTLLLMLLLSPFGWLYYFSLLLFPLVLSWQTLVTCRDIPPHLTALWFLAFFLVNVPLDYVMFTKMPDLISRMTLYSLFFYGLVLLIYVVTRLLGRTYPKTAWSLHKNRELAVPLFLILALGAVIPVFFYGLSLLKRLS
ncbi:DUF2029 domain-containing protein [Legionella sp. MW5194]|uniref:glycosyltransferase family 87 protein n=1 Tax=Legionella sp. MW5194 TaxID=2662448 RepID=UPI00193E57CC|nr:glycosyltransferase family 87 protein [Legionella sp. MW5194]QRN04779.1 DUF2029 domain-containing protein [Legionella sp. MW5194]